MPVEFAGRSWGSRSNFASAASAWGPTLGLGVLFILGGLLRFILPEEALAADGLRTAFATLGVSAAIGVHFLLFAADALRGRDAPRATCAVGLFWLGLLLFGLY